MQHTFAPHGQGVFPLDSGKAVSRDPIPPKASFGSKTIVYLLLLLAILSFRGVGDIGYTPYAVKFLITLSLCAPVMALARMHPLLGMELLIAAIMPIKIMMNHDYVTSSMYHILTVGMAVCVSSFPKQTNFDAGKNILLLFFYFRILQALRTVSVVMAVNQLCDNLDFFLLVYYIIPRLTAPQIARLLRVFYLGVTLTVVMIILTQGWDSEHRFGFNVLLNANGIGSTCALALTVHVHMNRGRPFGLIPLFFYVALGSAILFSGSRTAILLAVLILFIDMYRHNKLQIILLTVLVTVGMSYLVKTQAWHDNMVAKHMSKGLDGELDMEGISHIRVLLFLRGFDLIQENPVFGVGLANFQEMAQVLSPTTGKPLPSHNILLSVMSETGPFGILLLLAWFVVTCFRKKGFTEYGLGLTLALGLVGVTHGSFFNFLYAVVWGLGMALPPKEAKMPAPT